MKPTLALLSLLLATACVKRAYNTNVQQAEVTETSFLVCRAAAAPDSPITFRLDAQLGVKDTVVGFANKSSQGHRVTLDTPKVRSIQGTQWHIEVTGTLQRNAKSGEPETVDAISISVPNGGDGNVSLNILAQDPTHGIWIGRPITYTRCTVTDRSLLSRIPNPTVATGHIGYEDYPLGHCTQNGKNVTLVASTQHSNNVLKAVSLALKPLDAGSEAPSANITDLRRGSERSTARDPATGTETQVMMHSFVIKTESPTVGAPSVLSLRYGPKGSILEHATGRLQMAVAGEPREVPCWHFEDLNFRALFSE